MLPEDRDDTLRHVSTESYLVPATFDESLEGESPASAADRAAAIVRWMNLAVGGVILVIVGWIIVINAGTVWAKEHQRRKCGVDWILWLCGSEKTFEGTLLGAIEEGRKDFESRQRISELTITPLQFDQIQPVDFQWNHTAGRALLGQPQSTAPRSVAPRSSVPPTAPRQSSPRRSAPQPSKPTKRDSSSSSSR